MMLENLAVGQFRDAYKQNNLMATRKSVLHRPRQRASSPAGDACSLSVRFIRNRVEGAGLEGLRGWRGWGRGWRAGGSAGGGWRGLGGLEGLEGLEGFRMCVCVHVGFELAVVGGWAGGSPKRPDKSGKLDREA